MADIIQLTQDNGLAYLTFDDPQRGANVLSSSVLDELERHLDQLDEIDDLQGVIIRSAKRGIFVAGADLREFVASLDLPKAESEQICRRGQLLFARLAGLPCVTVAAIDGMCLGGGAELAIWCDRRVVTDNPRCQFGYPEVRLGLIPGWGGTSRTPRMIGLANAIEMVSGGKSVSGREAVELGIATDCVASDQLMAACQRLVAEEYATRAYVDDRTRWSGPIEISATELGFLGATAATAIRQETHGNYPAPEAALELMLEAAGRDLDTACQLEARSMAQLFGSPTNAALLNVFFLTDRNKKDRGVDGEHETTPVKQVGVVGAGIMGSGIAAANLKRSYQVWMHDAAPAALRSGLRQTLEEAAYDRALKGPAPGKLLEYSTNLHAIGGPDNWSQCDLVVEAIVENKDVKAQVLRRIEEHLNRDCILSTNTSTIPITELADRLARPERFCGLHFFNPVRRMQLVEVIRGEQTSDEAVASVVAYAKRLGKMPIVVKDGPGFLVNRLLVAYMNEALELLLEGVPIDRVERAATKFGMPMGPLTLYDVVGLDTALFAGRTLWEAYPDRIIPSPVLRLLVKSDRLGQKNGLGFFSYQNRKKKAQTDPAVDRLIDPLIRKRHEYTTEQLAMRLILPMLVEATRVLRENVVRDVRDVDMGLIFGIGFPAFRGGLLFWADMLGIPEILERLKPWESLGKRMEPTDVLLEMAATRGSFYAHDVLA